MSADRPVYSTEGAVLLALREHFSAPEYVLLPQVRNNAGFNATRTADALVMSVWPSRGLHLSGIEIKVSRADWFRELKQPEKCDEIACYCDFWYVAVGDEEIVKDGELPPTWGLIVPGKKDGSLRVKVQPTKLEAKPISRGFLAAILRKALETVVPLASVDAEIERRVAERLAEKEEVLRKRLTRDFDPADLQKRNTKLEAAASAFHEVTGVYLSATDVEDYRELGRSLQLLRYSGLSDWLKQCEESIARCQDSVGKLRKSLPQPKGQK